MNEESPDNSVSTPGGLPSEIGGYAVQRVLGTGGMATVYAALQKQPRRTVALKVMRFAADARSALHRFKREIEILGKLRHPYIAQVYDAGVHEEGGGPLPFFVMEYVPGAKTILEFADAKALSLRDRLKLFVKVCAAVEHGHLHRIIHRDLKPGNILIDKSGDPKIIDFGVARAMDMDLSAQTMHTEEGRLIGTIQYMAPEQLETKRTDVDARCDVYALGVLLYKLLTGRPPHDLVGLPVFTAAQVIRDDAPARPGSVKPELRGDLETIILKALAKERKERYRTAGSLGRDVVRFLAHKPIHARHVGIVHRLRLFARRHRTELRAAAVVGMVIVIAAAIVIYQRKTMSRTEEPSPGAEPPAVAEPPTEEPVPEPAPEAYTLSGLTGSVTKLAFSADGELLAGAADDLSLLVWNVEDRQIRLSASDHDEPVRHTTFSADGTLLVTAADDGQVVLIDTTGANVAARFRHRHGPVSAMDLAREGELVALTTDDLTVRVYDLGGSLLHTLRSTTGQFHTLAFSHRGQRLAAGSEGGDVYLWNAATGKQIGRFSGLRDPAIGLAFSADDRQVVAITARGAGMAWTIDAPGEPPRPFAVGLGEVRNAAFDPTGSWLACASADHVRVWNLIDAEPLGDAFGVENVQEILTLAVDASGSWLAIGAADGAVTMAPVPGDA